MTKDRTRHSTSTTTTITNKDKRKDKRTAGNDNNRTSCDNGDAVSPENTFLTLEGNSPTKLYLSRDDGRDGETNQHRQKKHPRKRKRQESKDQITPTSTPGHTPNKKIQKAMNDKKIHKSKNKKMKNPLNGLVVAISTQEVKSGEQFSYVKSSSSSTSSSSLLSQSTILSSSTTKPNSSKFNTSNLSYREVSNLCTSLGAQVTGTVHKKIFAVICNESAVLNNTQRVRKVRKKKFGVGLISVEWIQACIDSGSRVDYTPYLLNDLADQVMMESKTATTTSSSSSNNNVEGDTVAVDSGTKILKKEEKGVCTPVPVDVQEENDESILNSNIGWSEPVDLGCCCVCHETNRECKWCVDCPVTLRMKALLSIK